MNTAQKVRKYLKDNNITQGQFCKDNRIGNMTYWKHISKGQPFNRHSTEVKFLDAIAPAVETNVKPVKCGKTEVSMLETFEDVIYALYANKTVRVKDRAVSYRIENGVICSFDRFNNVIAINPQLVSDGSYYTVEPVKLKVTNTGKYLTRDGDEAFVYFIGESGVLYNVIGSNQTHSCGEDGKKFETAEHDKDLVEFLGE